MFAHLFVTKRYNGKLVNKLDNDFLKYKVCQAQLEKLIAKSNYLYLIQNLNWS
jgi:hypothetical protein